MPRVGKPVHTPDGDGVVAEVNILKESVRVRISKGNDMTELKEYPADQVQRLNGFQPQPAAASEEAEDAPDPEIMQALKASEMDVPDDDADAALPPDDKEGEAPEERPAPQRRRPSQRLQQQPRQERPRRRQPETDAAGENHHPPRPPRPPRAPKTPESAPKAAPQPAAKPEPAKPALAPAAPKRDPWVVPEEFRQKHE